MLILLMMALQRQVWLKFSSTLITLNSIYPYAYVLPPRKCKTVVIRCYDCLTTTWNKGSLSTPMSLLTWSWDTRMINHVNHEQLQLVIIMYEVCRFHVRKVNHPDQIQQDKIQTKRIISKSLKGRSSLWPHLKVLQLIHGHLTSTSMPCDELYEILIF